MIGVNILIRSYKIMEHDFIPEICLRGSNLYRLYAIIIDGKKYIGLTAKLVEVRKKAHISRCFSKSKQERSACPKLYNKIRKLYNDSVDAITNVKIIEIANTKCLDCAKYIENYLTLIQEDSLKNGLNSIPGGQYNPTKGKPLTEEHKNKISASNMGKKVSLKTRKLLSKINKGKILSEEHRKKLSLSHMGKPNKNKGGTLPIETKQKISKTLTGKTASAETRQKMSDSHPKGSNHPLSKLTEKQVIEIKKLIKRNIKLKDIANLFSVNPSTISDIKRGKIWRHINDN